ncbi:hypothetical protein KI387_031489, partial [Taxus chinensis]
FRQVFTFSDALIAQIYYELWMYTTGRRTGIDVSFVLHCWAYEHIVVIRPSGLPWMPAAVGAIDYGFLVMVGRHGPGRYREICIL